VYKNRSVAEQNSVELAWALLMDHQFTDLRRAIYINEVEYRRFRELVVNTVLATDIMDKELGQLRKKRWNDAFSVAAEQQAATDAADEAAKMYSTNRKATIVLEHLIQASDVSHTMQVSAGNCCRVSGLVRLFLVPYND
jgi:3'5'-cyclic nucleotide phosphodiesterase